MKFLSKAYCVSLVILLLMRYRAFGGSLLTYLEQALKVDEECFNSSSTFKISSSTLVPINYLFFCFCILRNFMQDVHCNLFIYRENEVPENDNGVISVSL